LASADDLCLARYFRDAEVQAEDDAQIANLRAGLSDALKLPVASLRKKRYRDYQGKSDAWDLRTLLGQHLPGPVDCPNYSLIINCGSVTVALMRKAKWTAMLVGLCMVGALAGSVAASGRGAIADAAHDKCVSKCNQEFARCKPPGAACSEARNRCAMACK
jgi:hypothetical protein